MSPDLISIRTRLAAVDPGLTLLKDILAAWYEGSDRLAADPLTLPGFSLELSRRNPVLGAALGLGAVEAAASLDDEPGQAHAGAALGIALVYWGSFAEALPVLEQAMLALEGRTLLTARWHGLVCEAHLGLRPDAVCDLLAAADALEQAGDSLGAHRCRVEAAPMLVMQGDREGALRLAKSARLHFVRRDLPVDVGIALAARAATRLSCREFGPGQEDLNRAEGIFLQFNMPTMLCAAWLQRGIYYQLQSQVDKALHWLEAARDRAESLKHDYYQMLSLLEIAPLQFSRGEVERSLAIHHTIRRIASSGKLAGVLADSELTTANWQLRRGEYDAAAAGYRRAREQYATLGNRHSVAVCTMNLGLIAGRQGNASESQRLLDEAQAAFEADGLVER